MNFLIKPWDHQLKAIDEAKDKTAYAFLFEQGTGKTGAAINTIRHKFNSNRRFMRTLIFCPPIVIDNWKNEFKLHSNVDPNKILLLKGASTSRVKLLNKAFVFDPESNRVPQPAIAVTNYEALLMKDLYALLQEWKPEIIVFDESHYLKSIASSRSILAHRLANPRDCVPPIKYLLTGTPVLNSPLDIFMQYKIMDGGETFGDNFYVFRTRYCIDRNAGMPKKKYFPNWQPRTFKRDGVDSYNEISKKIFEKGMRVEKSECLDLPPMVYQKMSVDMPKTQALIYRQLKQDLIAYVDEGVVVAELAITKALRLLQIASGFYKTDDGQEIVLKNNPKLTALKDLLRDLTVHHKVIIWCVFKKNYEQIRELCESLKIEAVEVHGGISEKGKRESVDRFTNNKKVRVLFGHPASGGIGINLVEASYSIFYSRNFDLGQSLQAEARNYRGGSEKHKKITRIDMVAAGTIDEYVMEKLKGKVDMTESILTDIVQELKRK